MVFVTLTFETVGRNLKMGKTRLDCEMHRIALWLFFWLIRIIISSGHLV